MIQQEKSRAHVAHWKTRKHRYPMDYQVGLEILWIRLGNFPILWKKRLTVLLQKPTKLSDNPTSYRFICLLDNVGKLFQRLLTTSEIWNISGEPSWFFYQFGFNERRSIIDATEGMVWQHKKARTQNGPTSWHYTANMFIKKTNPSWCKYTCYFKTHFIRVLWIY